MFEGWPPARDKITDSGCASTASRAIRNAMIAALAAFLGVWFAGKALLGATGLPVAAGNDVNFIHLLMAAYFAHLLARAVFLTIRWRRRILAGG